MIHLINRKGCAVFLNEIGAGIVSVVVPDRNGRMEDVVLGYADPLSYIGDGPCAGKIPGRYANRIAGGHFSLNGKDYRLEINNGPNHLHGGKDGFSNRRWELLSRTSTTAHFRLTSPDGDQGYPGEVTVDAVYEWSEDNALTLNLEAVSDRDTILNLTNHTYWNLRGENSGDILDHVLTLNASRWLPTDATLIPTGELAGVDGTPMDFRRPKRIGEEIHADFEALKFGKGYDNCWVVDGEGMRKAATLEDPDSGRRLEVWTTQPGVQVYTGNWLAHSPRSKSGREYRDYEGVAIECQNFPDAPNRPEFPSSVLRKGEIYRQTIRFVLSAE